MGTVAIQQRAPFFQLRDREYGRLAALGETYLDYAGGALFPASLLREHARVLESNVYGNPHSDSGSSRASTALIAAARQSVLQFFGADAGEYSVIFTANTSAAIRIVAEAFPFDEHTPFVLTSDNHNSVNGIREYARAAGGTTRYVQLDDELRVVDVQRALRETKSGLFAFPAQSNFSGVQHPLSLVRSAQARGYRVLVDAAAWAPTHPLSLREITPDYVAVSFYKMFGYPGGVGALIIRKDALDALRPRSFAGGTVDFVSVQNDSYRRASGVAGFEEGTANFLGIAAIPLGLDFLSTIGMDRVERHVATLTQQALAELSALRTRTGRAKVILYGPQDCEDRGGTIAFNLVDDRGHVIPFEHVEAHARAAGVSIRGGCFCNPGASERALGLPAAKTRAYMSGNAAFSIDGMRRHLGGAAVGALRCSFGVPTNRTDISRLTELLATVG